MGACSVVGAIYSLWNSPPLQTVIYAGFARTVHPNPAGASIEIFNECVTEIHCIFVIYITSYAQISKFLVGLQAKMRIVHATS